MNSKLKLGLSGASVMVLAACAPVDAGFGEALRYDMAAQTVDPDPVYAESGAKPGDSGKHAADATKRYREGNTKPVQVQSTKSGGGSGSGSGGGSGQ